jgi:hypothetical protein
MCIERKASLLGPRFLCKILCMYMLELQKEIIDKRCLCRRGSFARVDSRENGRI